MTRKLHLKVVKLLLITELLSPHFHHSCEMSRHIRTRNIGYGSRVMERVAAVSLLELVPAE